MELMERIAATLGDKYGQLLTQDADGISEIRVRTGRPLQIVYCNRKEYLGDIISQSTMERLLSSLMDNSLYAKEAELRQGYFTTFDGYRIGVCGRTCAEDGGISSFSSIGSICIRNRRQVMGCADKLMDMIEGNGLKSLLVISPPGCGKTTLLRDVARQLSGRGYNVAIADERREIAACTGGVPQLDVGIRTDVMDGCPKAVAIPLLVRACAPDVLIADEIGTQKDALALLDAARCGVKVIASAHAYGYADVIRRKSISPALQEGAFDCWALLGPEPGRIKYIRHCAEEVI